MNRPECFFESLGPNPRILLIRLRSLGDVVLMTPLLESIGQARRDAVVDVVVEHPFSEVLYENPFVHQLLELKSEPRVLGVAQHQSPAGAESAPLFLTKRQAIFKIRRSRYAAVWNLHGGSTAAWMTALSGAPFRLGCASFRNQFAYNVRIPDSAKLLGRATHHTVERGLAWFDWLNGASRQDFSEAPALKVVVSQSARVSARRKLEEAGMNPDQEYVVIQPTAVFATKEWMGERFAAVADFLAGQGYQVALTGSAPERRKLERIKTLAKSEPAVLAHLTIREMIAVLDGARLYIGNDSGPAHLAAALNKPTVVLFGSSNSTAWSPWRTRSAVVQNPFDCNPCSGYRCLKFAEPECIKSITVEQVKAAVQHLFEA